MLINAATFVGMADVVDRDKWEAELARVLEVVWTKWSKTNDPDTLTEEGLIEILRENAIDPVWNVWIRAHLDLLEQYGQEQDQAALAAAFLLFFRQWSEDLSRRWKSRVSQWQEDYRQSQQTPPVTVATTSMTISGNQLPVVEPAAPVSPWRRAKHEIVQPHDAKAEAVTSITQTQTDSERRAVATVETRGVERLIPIWVTEPGACPVCSPLEGQPPNVWRLVAPDGPPQHRNCRCSLQWRAFLVPPESS